jgi:hypothetical protein
MATATKTRAPAGKTPPLGALIDQMWALRDKKRALEASIKDLEGQIGDIESSLMEQMNEQGVDKMSGALATVSITTNTVAQVEDWDAFWAFIHKKKYGHLLQRRVSDPAYRELLGQGVTVPGVSPFSKARLNLRAR